MDTIKIGRTEYQIKKGDYILDNGACYQFCSGDGRTLKQVGYTGYTNLVLPKSLVNKITFSEMTKKESNRYGQNLIYYIFK
jgi:hypothetical protein